MKQRNRPLKISHFRMGYCLYPPLLIQLKSHDIYQISTIAINLNSTTILKKCVD